MPSVNIGKAKIKSIKVYKDHVTLSFLKREKLQISKEAYLSSYLYEDKALSQKEIDKLLEITAVSKLLNYGISLLNKRRYSERKMYDKLKAKEDNKSSIRSVINTLKDKGLLNDKEYMQDLIAWDDERKLGKNKIIIPAICVAVLGGISMFFAKNQVGVMIAGTVLMSGYMIGTAVLGAKVRDYTPPKEVGLFQGIRMIFLVMIPMVTGPYIGQGVSYINKVEYINEFGRTVIQPNAFIFLFAGIVLALAVIPTIFVIGKEKQNAK